MKRRQAGRQVGVLGLVLVMAGCSVAPPATLSDAEREDILSEELAKASPVAAPAPERPLRVFSRATERLDAAPDALDARVTLVGQEVPLANVLSRLAAQARLKLNVEREVKIDAPVTARIQDLSVRDALRTVLTPLDLYSRVDSGELVVYGFETRGWTLSLPALSLSSSTAITNDTGGTSPSSTITDPLGGTTGAGAGGQNHVGVNLGARARVTSKTPELSTWDELEKTLRAMVSKHGVLTVNRSLGMITLRDRPDQVRGVDEFLVRYEAESAQQIAVEVRALEVTLSASDTYGINWSRVWSALFGSGSAVSLAGTFATPLTLPISLGLQQRHGAVDVLVKALSTQGKVKVLAQPSIRLLNGHPAVIQVGRVTAFVAEASQTTTGSLGTSTFSVRLGSVQDGVILPLTARVVGDNVVMNLAPILSRVRQIRTVTSGTTTVEAPDVDNRALQTTVRLRSGETVVLGGLISNSDTDNRSGLPGIVRTFRLGWLTGSLDQRSERTEVVLTLTPKIVPALTAARQEREGR